MVNKDNYVLNFSCTNYASRYTRAMAYPWLKKEERGTEKEEIRTYLKATT